MRLLIYGSSIIDDLNSRRNLRSAQVCYRLYAKQWILRVSVFRCRIHFVRQSYESLSVFWRQMKMAKSQPSYRGALRTTRLQGALLVALVIAATLLIIAARPRAAHAVAPNAYAIKDAQIITGTGKTLAK